MPFPVAKFLANPGRRFPIHVTLDGRQDPDNLCTVASIELDGEGFAQLSTMYFDEVTLQAHLVQPCRRCLTPVQTTLEIEESFEIPVPPGSESVDLLPIVLRLVLSAHEPNVVCKAECRGLCPICGVNLNVHPDHHCQSEEPDRMTLRDLLT